MLYLRIFNSGGVLLSTPSHVDFDRDRLRPLLDSGSSMFQLVSYEWERVDGA